MTKAILFGAIGTLAETSDLQRKAFNDAFAEAGLDWHWSEDAYQDMLGQSGGQKRIAAYAEARGETVDAAGLHQRKSELYQDALKDGIAARPQILEVIHAALGMNVKLALVSTTSRENIDALLAALPEGIHEGIFAFIGDSSQVENGKPASDIYDLALKRLGLDAADVIAVEDSPTSVQAAVNAGIPTIAFPGRAHADRLFPNAEVRVDTLTPELFGLGRALGDDTLKAAIA